jgi:uncharacterized protein YfaS (alpha-2-macroglobulin family)
MAFHPGETAILSVEVKDVSGFLDPDSITVSVLDPRNLKIVDGQAMEKDGTGKYHYDLQPNSIVGKYEIIYTATHGSRIVKEKDILTVEAL